MTTADTARWTYHARWGEITDEKGIRIALTAYDVIAAFLLRHGPAILSGRDPLAVAQAEIERLRADKRALLTQITASRSLAQLAAAGPVMPETPSEAALDAIYAAGEHDCATLYAMLRAALSGGGA